VLQGWEVSRALPLPLLAQLVESTAALVLSTHDCTRVCTPPPHEAEQVDHAEYANW